MPRKIDDVRRMALLKACALLAVAATVVWGGYDAWMRPYRARRRRLEEEVREGKSFLEQLQTRIAMGRAGDLAVIRDRLKAIASSSDGRAPVPDAGPGTGEYAAAITEYMEARKAVQSAARKAAALAGSIDGMLEGGPGGKKTRAEARAQDLSDALAAMEAVRDAGLPSAAAAEAAEKRFNGAYGKAMEAANRIPEWRRMRTDAEAIAKEMAEAKRRLEEASGRIRGIRKARAEPTSPPSDSVLGTLRKVDGELERAAAEYLAVRQEAHEKVEEAYAKCRRASAALREARRAANRWPREAKETLRGAIAAWSELQPQLRKHKAALEKRGAHGTEMLRQADAIRSEVQKMLRESGSARGIDATRVARLQAEGASVRYGLERAAAALGGEAFQRLLDDFAGRADSILETVRKAKEVMSKRAFRSWKEIAPRTAGLAGRACVRTAAGDGVRAMEDNKWQRA